MWEVLSQNDKVTKSKNGDMLELRYSNGVLIRWIPTDETNSLPNGKLVAFIPHSTATGLTVPPGIEEIGYGAFAFYEKDEDVWETRYNPNLKTIDLPSTIKHVENGAFAFCDLEEIVIPDNCPAVKIVDGAVLSKDGKRFIYKLAEKNCDSEYIIPDGVEEIGEEAFNSWRKDVVISDSVKKICAFAFGVFCNTIIVPATVNEIEENAFSKDCTLLVVKNSYAHKWAKKHKMKSIALKWSTKMLYYAKNVPLNGLL